MHHSNSNQNMSVEEANRGVAVEKLDSVKKWGINTYKVQNLSPGENVLKPSFIESSLCSMGVIATALV